MQEQEQNPSSEDFSLYRSPSAAVSEVKELKEVSNPLSLTSIRIMHSMNLKSMIGIEKFTELVELNLSSNSIERMEGLGTLTKLRVLNLSCNRIRVINGLNNLKFLEKLVLASNRVFSLQPLNQLYGGDYSLKILDLKDNKITELSQLKYLAGLVRLQEISFCLEDDPNPTFQNKKIYLKTLQSLPIWVNLKSQKVDGRNAADLLTEIQAEEDLEREPVEQEQELEVQRYVSPAKQETKQAPQQGKTKSTGKTPQQIPAKPQYGARDKTPPSHGHPFLQENIDPQQNFHEMEQVYKKELKGLQEKLQSLFKDHKELLYKYECNEKYWTAKCQKLEENIHDLTQEHRDFQSKNSKLQATIQAQDDEIAELTNKLTELKSKKDKKEDLVDKLQTRIAELLKENGEFHKEIGAKIEEIGKLKETVTASEGRIAELKSIIRENEKNLTELHTKAIETSNLNLHRSEDLQRRYDDLQKNFELKTDEMKKLVERNYELVELVKEWERKYDDKIQEAHRNESERFRSIGDEWAQRLDEIEKTHKKEIAKNEEKFKENMDLLEEEFKKVLLENNDKFKTLKAAFEEKVKHEAEMKQFTKMTVAKNAEFEKIIEEQNEMLRKFKEQYTILMQEKDSIEKNSQGKLQTIKSDLNSYQANLERLQNEKENINKYNHELEEQIAEKSKELGLYKRKLIDLETKSDELVLENEKLRSKLRNFEDKAEEEISGLVQELEDLKDKVSVKNKMLEDKNQAIAELKELVQQKEEDVEHYRSMKAETTQLQDDLDKEKQYAEKMKRKYDKQVEYSQELEDTIASLKEEKANLEDMIMDLREQEAKKNHAIETFEREITMVRSRQDREGNLLREKDKRLEELEGLLEECKNNLIKKKDQQREFEERMRRQEMEVTSLLIEKDSQIKELKRRLIESDEEMKVLIVEVERQKKMAKESVEKLANLFK